jgi:hypothetical protein
MGTDYALVDQYRKGEGNMTLREELKPIITAAILALDRDGPDVAIEGAILAGVRLVLEQEASEGMLKAADMYRDEAVCNDEPWTSKGTYRAMNAERLKELEGEK